MRSRTEIGSSVTLALSAQDAPPARRLILPFPIASGSAVRTG